MAHSTPTISVCIISYNQKQYLAEAIESVLHQTLPPYEIIIVDDYPQDGSQDIIKDYAQKHEKIIRAFYNTRNLGVVRTRAIALEKVKGDLVTYLDGDDRFLPRKLEWETETYLKNPHASIVYSNIYYIDNKGERSRMREANRAKGLGKETYLLKWSRREWICVTGLLNMNAIKKSVSTIRNFLSGQIGM